MPTTASFQVAPRGFTDELWERIDRDGYLIMPGVLSRAEIDGYLAAIARMSAADPTYKPTVYWGRQNAVEGDRALEDLIDRPSHIGFAYDLYGELTKLHLSQVMRRPRGGTYNLWHPDGARALPYQVFSPDLPLQFKVGYWLTDVPQARMGNLVVYPGSHKRQYFAGYDTHDSLPGELVVTAKAGDMILFHAGLWHRVEPNESDQVRQNIFLTYSPAWVVSEDRHENTPDFLAGLTRERRILMRSYRHPYDNQKPPAADVPLYLDRETGRDRDEGCYREHVDLHRRKRLTWWEKRQARLAGKSLST